MTFGLALLFIGMGAVQWARKLMDDEEMVDYRHGAASSDEDRTYMLTSSTRWSTSPSSPAARSSAAA